MKITKANIKIEDKWQKEIQTKFGPKMKTFFRYGNCIFSGFSDPGWKVGETKEIEYDKDSQAKRVWQGKTNFYYNLVLPKRNKVQQLDLTPVLKELEEIKRMIRELEIPKEAKGVPEDEEDEESWEWAKEIPEEEDIPVVEDDDEED